MSIVLIGLPASGKTTVGVKVAERLGVDFVDTDAMVEGRTGKLVAEIFAEEGEAEFRRLEEEAAADALSSAGVVSLGGGAIMNPRIREMVGGHQVVWLDVSVKTLTRRAGMARLRPLLLGDVRAQMTALAAERLPVYEQAATWRVDAEQSVSQVVSQILKLVSSLPPAMPSSPAAMPSPFAVVPSPLAAMPPSPVVVPSPPAVVPSSPVVVPSPPVVVPPSPVVVPPSLVVVPPPLVILPQAGSPYPLPATPAEDPAPCVVVEVDTDHPYEVLVGRRAVSRAGEILEGASRTALLHPPVLRSQAVRLAESLPGPTLVEVPEGERAKTADVLDHCWRALAQAGVTRSDAVVGLGGGSTTDLAGFVAATMLRGISYLAVPTTVLGMADAAVGGKTGINLPEGKNLVGAFYEPRAVLCDLDLLDGLPAEEVRSGLGEILKCGFIADPGILDLAEQDPARLGDTSSGEFADALTRAVRVKAGVVSADFRENSASGAGREALNYGHTLGHAIEKVEGFTWAHGCAVSVGMVFAAEVALRLGMIRQDVVDRMRRILKSVGLPVQYSSAPWGRIREAMSLDKKSRGSHLRLVLLDGIGRVRVVPDVDEDVLRQSFLAVGGVE